MNEMPDGQPRSGIGDSTRVFEERVAPTVEHGAPFALIDFPDHSNVGDSAIYAGESVFFDKFAGRHPSYVCTTRSYRRDVERSCPEGVLYLHGGGNFGDMWKPFHDLRLDVLRHYRSRRIVQLPQSIHFSQPSRIAETQRAIADHPDFTLFVRDEESADFARRNFDCQVTLAPDAAVNLRSLDTRVRPSDLVISLLREDKEKSWTDAGALVAAHGPIVDWPPHSRFRQAPLRALEIGLARLPPAASGLMRVRNTRYRRQAWGLVRTGTDILGRGRHVVTDRLHAHLLSCLMGKEHIVLDNSYGKLTRYISAWGDHGLARVAGDMEALASELKRLASDAGTQGNQIKTHALGRG
jgi:pyruvyl transferase EpsO